ARMRALQYPILFRGSKYAERMPIGKKETIERADPKALKRFYKTWYRPDLMAVIAVGDFDRAKIEELIKRQFSGLRREPGAPARPMFPVPGHEEILYAIATDKEETNSSVGMYHLLPVREDGTAGAYRQMIVERLFNTMLNERFSELAQKPDPPFLGAASSKGRFIGSKDVYVLSALVAEGGIERGLKALAGEGERLARFGFTATELERQKAEMLRTFERAFTERETEDSNDYAEEFTRSFLQGEPTPGIEFEYEAHKHFLPGITLEDVNRLAREWMTGPDRVVVVNAPDKPGLRVPADKDLAAVLEAVKAEPLTPYEDTVSDQPLLPEPPAPGTIVATRTVPDVDLTEWTLSNGVRVVLKPTRFKEDEILVRAISPGGVSLAAEDNLIPANTADEAVASGGLDGFSAVDLQKKLAGKAVSIRPTIGELEEGLSGSASPKDAETLFQLIYLTFTAPRADPAVFDVLKTQLKAVLENRTKSPEVVFGDTLRSALQRDQPRFRPMTVDEIPRMSLEKSMAFYKDRFADASDFTFLFVGNVDVEAVKPLVCRYLATLPATHRAETWKDWRVPPPEGVVKRTVEKGLEPKSLTAVVFSGPFKDTLDNRNAIDAACQVLETRLRKLLREKMGGTYDVSVNSSTSKIPREEFRVSIDLGADPHRIDELSRAVFSEIAKLQTDGPEEKEAEEVRTADFRDYETNSRQNGWWLSELAQRFRLNEDPSELLRIPDSLKRITRDAVRDAARAYFDTRNYVQVTLYPEKKR
ncbi:MAG TPA: insulinase family protein, partial [Acidobacteriota bacterium]|nr:insulinase family protein [Acidobacteriota bacterium]